MIHSSIESKKRKWKLCVWFNSSFRLDVFGTRETIFYLWYSHITKKAKDFSNFLIFHVVFFPSPFSYWFLNQLENGQIRMKEQRKFSTVNQKHIPDWIRCFEGTWFRSILPKFQVNQTPTHFFFIWARSADAIWIQRFSEGDEKFFTHKMERGRPSRSFKAIRASVSLAMHVDV